MSTRKLPSRILEPSQNIANIETQGIKFPVTQVPSADPNTLDDYEEGTWTPYLAGGSTAGTWSESGSQGFYIRIGRMVQAWYRANGVLSGASGEARLYGLPFAVPTEIAVYSSGAIQFWSGATTEVFGGLPRGGTSYVYYHYYANGRPQSGILDVSQGVNGTNNLHGFVCYYTDQ